MTFANSLRATLDKLRAIPAKLGLRSYTVTVRVRSWSGDRPGDGVLTDTLTQLTVDGYAPKVKQLTQQDVIASGGLYQDQDLEVSLTPEFTVNAVTGGVTVQTFDPPVGAAPTEVAFIVEGPGLPEGGSVFKKIGQRVDSELTYRITLRNTGEAP